MVTQKEALIASGLSAAAVWLVHTVVHGAGLTPPQVGGVVFLSVLVIGYFGMRGFKLWS